MAIEFRKVIKQTRFLSPRQNFQEVRTESEIRVDPLTGATGRICHLGLPKLPQTDLTELVKQSQANCPFCSEALERLTPRFPPDIIPGGRVGVGEAVVIPNILPYDTYSAVGIMSKSHFIPLAEFGQETLVNAFKASLEFCWRVLEKEKGNTLYPLIFWNYMPPSGSTQIHPHLQMVVTSEPGNTFRSIMKASQQYYERYSQNYWADLAVEERRWGERYVAEIGNTVWLVPFIPASMFGGVLVILRGKPSLQDLTENDLIALAAGLRRVFRFLSDENIYSFNLAFYPGLPVQDYLWAHLILIPRAFSLPKLGTFDCNALDVLYGERFSVTYPEEFCHRLRSYF